EPHVDTGDSVGWSRALSHPQDHYVTRSRRTSSVGPLSEDDSAGTAGVVADDVRVGVDDVALRVQPGDATGNTDAVRHLRHLTESRLRRLHGGSGTLLHGIQRLDDHMPGSVIGDPEHLG